MNRKSKGLGILAEGCKGKSMSVRARPIKSLSHVYAG